MWANGMEGCMVSVGCLLALQDIITYRVCACPQVGAAHV